MKLNRSTYDEMMQVSPNIANAMLVAAVFTIMP
jgi:hypothetical protein